MANEIRFKIGLDGYSLTKQQVEDLDKAMKKLGTTVEKQPGLARAILGGMGARPTPPIIGAAPPPLPAAPGGINWKLAATSLLASGFSPWVGARGLNQAGVGGSLGRAIGIGGVASSIFGPGGFAGFMVDFLAIHLVIKAVTFAFEHLKKAVEDGARLFEQAAEVGKQPGRLFALQQTLGPLGISPDQLTRLMVRGENPLRSGGRTLSLTDTLLGAGRGVMQMGELQRIQNMRQYIDLLDKEVRLDSFVMQNVSQGLFNIKVEWTQLLREWNTLWSDIADVIGPMVIMAMQNLRNQLQAITLAVEAAKAMFPILGAMKFLTGYPTQGLNNMQTGGFNTGAQDRASAWERMGFIMGGVGIGDYAQQTAESTKETAMNTHHILETIKSGGGLQMYPRDYFGTTFANAP